VARSSADALRIRALRVLGSADAIMAQQSSDEVRVLGRTRVRSEARCLRGWARREADADHAAAPRRRRAGQLRGELPAPRACGPGQRRGPGARSGHQILRDELSLPLNRIDNGVSARLAPADVAALLQIDALTPVLVSENVTYAAEATPVDVARIHYRGDRFTFAISLDIP
jgi:GntR family transcriptional regulator